MKIRINNYKRPCKSIFVKNLDRGWYSCYLIPSPRPPWRRLIFVSGGHKTAVIWDMDCPQGVSMEIESEIYHVTKVDVNIEVIENG